MISNYDVAADGASVVAVIDLGAAPERDQVTVVMNFFDELRRRVP